MTQIISTLLAITKGAFLTAGLIILLRLLLKNILSAKAKYYLWLLLALRLVLPTLPESPWSLMNLIPESQNVQMESVIETEHKNSPLPAVEVPIVTATEIPTTEAEAPAMTTAVYPEPEVTYSLTPEGWFLVIWMGGMAVMLLGYATLYTITGLRLRKLPDCQDKETLETLRLLNEELGIRQNIRLAIGGGGMLGGIFHPTIVLPTECYGQTAKPILLHELLHYKYKDLWIYLLFRLLTVIHWFNPLVWLCFRQARQDSEAACDQRVMDSELVETIVYAQTLYREGVLSRRGRILMQTSFGSTSHTLRRRIAAISKYSGKRLWVTVLALCLAVVVCACTLTSEETIPPEDSTLDITVESSISADSLSEETDNTSNLDDTSLETTIYSPYRLEDDQILFGNTHWSMTEEEVIIAEDLDRERRTSTGETDISRNDKYPIPGHPEVESVQYTFYGKDNLFGMVIVRYDTDLISYEQLVAQRTGELGDPTQINNNQTSWETGSTALSVLALEEDTLQETLIVEEYLHASAYPSEQDTFFYWFHELDKRSMMDYVEEHPDVLSGGWGQIEINQAGLDDSGTGIMTTNGHEVLAIDVKNGILLLRVYCDDSRGVMAILKDSSRLINASANNIGTSGQTVGAICNDIGGLLAINGSAFLDDDNGTGGHLAGSAVCSGKVLGESLGGTYKRLELRDDGRMYIVDSASAISENTLEACEFKPALIVDGQILVDENCGWTAPSPRTAIGQSKQLETMMVVIEGRMLDSLGSSVVDIAELMAQYGCIQALNLDGGTSSVMYYKGEYVTRCSNTALPEGRKLPTAWVYR